MLYVGMTQVKSHEIQVITASRTSNQAFKTNPKSLMGQYPAIQMPKSASSALYENTLTRDFMNSVSSSSS